MRLTSQQHQRQPQGKQDREYCVALELHDPAFQGLYLFTGDSLKLVHNLKSGVLISRRQVGVSDDISKPDCC